MSKANPNGEEIARLNEDYIIRETQVHNTIREDDLSTILSWSIQMVQRTTKRLVAVGRLIRMRAHGAYFVAIKNRTDTIKLKPTWRHDALAIVALGEIRDQHPNATIETEARIRERIQMGKIPDGIITGPNVNIRIEVELSHKSGHPMEKQSREAVILAKQGVTTYFIYPYPPNDTYIKYPWEDRIASAVRDELNHDNPEPYIRLIRCYMPKRLHFEHCRPTNFEIIDLPSKPTNSRIRQGKNKLGTVVIQGHHWKLQMHFLENGSRHQFWVLYWDNHKKGMYQFVESLSYKDGDEHEMWAINEKDEWVPTDAFPTNNAWDSFKLFVVAGKEKAEKKDAALMQISGTHPVQLPVEIPTELD